MFKPLHRALRFLRGQRVVVEAVNVVKSSRRVSGSRWAMGDDLVEGLPELGKVRLLVSTILLCSVALRLQSILD